MFYRHDGTLYFDTIAHEGECYIYPDCEKEIEEILSYGNWFPTENGIPTAPAKLHRLVPDKAWNLFRDPLYLKLRKLQSSPKEFAETPDFESFLTFIEGPRPAKFIRCVPQWYLAFEMYLLGEFNAKTNAELTEVFAEAGLSDQDAYQEFYSVLDRFSEEYALVTGDHSG